MTESEEVRVRRALAAYSRDCQPLPEGDSLRQIGTGFSGAAVWKVTAARGALCLKGWPAAHPGPDRVAHIQRVIREIADRGFPLLAVPIAPRPKAQPARTQTAGIRSPNATHIVLDGSAWELAPWLPGKADTSPRPTNETVAAAARTLAEFHLAAARLPAQLMAGLAAAPELAARYEALRESRQDIPLLHRTFQHLRSTRTNAHGSALPQEARSALLLPWAEEFLTVAEAEGNRVEQFLREEFSTNVTGPAEAGGQPCLRDIWREHVLFADDDSAPRRVTGLVDYGGLSRGGVAIDIARLLGSFADECEADSLAMIVKPDLSAAASAWHTGLTAYQELRPLSSAELREVVVLRAIAAVMSGMHWLRWIYLEQRSFDDDAAVVRRFRASLLRLRHFQQVPDVVVPASGN